jgi:hypothetical protein
MATVRRPRSIDRRRKLLPRDYLANPYLFGVDLRAEMYLPPDGDAESLEIARVLHRCFAARRHCEQHISGAELGRIFGFSRQSWSMVTQGQRWPGHTMLTAVIAALDPGFQQRHRHHDDAKPSA